MVYTPDHLSLMLESFLSPCCDSKADCILWCSAAVVNWGLLVLILYTLYYMALEPFAGATWGLFLGIPMWLTATAFCQHVPYAWAWAAGLHVLSWFLQVIMPFIVLLDSFFLM